MVWLVLVALQNTPEVLLSHEYENNFHHLALTENVLRINASLVKLRIRRLLVDANQEMGNWDEVIRLSALPEMNKCKNVMQALATAHTKTNNWK
jgi:hypothetical protein